MSGSVPFLTAGGLALGLGSAFVLGLTVLGGGGAASGTASGTVEVSPACALVAPTPGLSPSQRENAATVVSVALASSGENEHVARIALMVALTESGLQDLSRGNLDSLGIFQQRPSQGWGTPAQLSDPAYATAAFVRALLALPGWASMAPWAAAQAVQRSATSTGSNYEASWSKAGAVLSSILAAANAPGACGQGGGAVAGPVPSAGLPAGYAIPPGTPPEHAAVVAFALSQLGKPYVFGAAGPSAYDCSGLTMAAWASVGVGLEHYTGAQQDEGSPVAVTGLVPGDLVLVPGSDAPGPGVAGHVGIYLGDDLVVSAIDPALGVAVQTWSTFVSGGLVALRDPAPGA